MVFVLIGITLAVGWLLVLVQVHCMAAVALYVSARARTSVTAGLLAYGVVWVPALCIGCAALIAFFILGPILLGVLMLNFDTYALKD